MYYPDFYLPSMGRLVEVKGDHFFEDGDPSKPLRSVFGRKCSDSKCKAKHKAMLENNVLVLSSRRYMLY